MYTMFGWVWKVTKLLKCCQYIGPCNLFEYLNLREVYTCTPLHFQRKYPTYYFTTLIWTLQLQFLVTLKKEVLQKKHMMNWLNDDLSKVQGCQRGILNQTQHNWFTDHFNAPSEVNGSRIEHSKLKQWNTKSSMCFYFLCLSALSIKCFYSLTKELWMYWKTYFYSSSILSEY